MTGREGAGMSEDQFSAMLAIIVPPVIEQITKNSNVDGEKAISRFYQSRLYQELSDETSKLWHYGPMNPVYHVSGRAFNRLL